MAQYMGYRAFGSPNDWYLEPVTLKFEAVSHPSLSSFTAFRFA